jgi:hypothetical protein
METLLKTTERIALHGELLEQATGVIETPSDDEGRSLSLLK